MRRARLACSIWQHSSIGADRFSIVDCEQCLADEDCWSVEFPLAELRESERERDSLSFSVDRLPFEHNENEPLVHFVPRSAFRRSFKFPNFGAKLAASAERAKETKRATERGKETKRGACLSQAITASLKAPKTVSLSLMLRSRSSNSRASPGDCLAAESSFVVALLLLLLLSLGQSLLFIAACVRPGQTAPTCWPNCSRPATSGSIERPSMSAGREEEREKQLCPMDTCLLESV